MAEKVKRLGLPRDYKKYIYFLDAEGSVWRAAKPRAGEPREPHVREVVAPHAITRDSQYLYFVDKEGDISRSPRVGRRRRAA
ncbi:MAG: hypothetical protein ACRD2E_13020 [Terriglobales bacterium]